MESTSYREVPSTVSTIANIAKKNGTKKRNKIPRPGEKRRTRRQRTPMKPKSAECPSTVSTISNVANKRDK